MRRLCVVPCGSLKIWSRNPNAGPTRARDVYIGLFARTCIEYAEKFYPDSYVILSAKYGFLFPDELIPEDYNVTFNDPKTKPIGVEELKKQAEEKGLTKYDEIVVIAGSNYVNIVRKVFEGKKIVTPLKGLDGMGMMISAMKNAIREGKELVNEGMNPVLHLNSRGSRNRVYAAPQVSTHRDKKKSGAPNAEDFQKELDRIFEEAVRRGESFVVVKSGDLHRRVGGYPGSNHRMPLCCSVMRKNMRAGDEVVSEPPKGAGASLVIKYKLPR